MLIRKLFRSEFSSFLITFISVIRLQVITASFLTEVVVLQNQHKPGGQFQGAGVALTTCLDMCAQTASCLGIDYNTNGNTCWFHDSGSICSAAQTKPSCSHYSFTNNCPTLPASKYNSISTLWSQTDVQFRTSDVIMKSN